MGLKDLKKTIKKESHAGSAPKGFARAHKLAAKAKQKYRRDDYWSKVWDARVPWVAEVTPKGETRKPTIYSMQRVKTDSVTQVLLITAPKSYFAHKINTRVQKSGTYALTDYVRCNKYVINDEAGPDDAPFLETERYCPFCELYSKNGSTYPPRVLNILGIVDLDDDGTSNKATPTRFPGGAPKLAMFDDPAVMESITEDVGVAAEKGIPHAGMLFVIERDSDTRSPRTGRWAWNGKALDEKILYNKTKKRYELKDAQGAVEVLYYKTKLSHALPALDGLDGSLFPVETHHKHLMLVAQRHVGVMVELGNIPDNVNTNVLKEIQEWKDGVPAKSKAKAKKLKAKVEEVEEEDEYEEVSPVATATSKKSQVEDINDLITKEYEATDDDDDEEEEEEVEEETAEEEAVEEETEEEEEDEMTVEEAKDLILEEGNSHANWSAFLTAHDIYTLFSEEDVETLYAFWCEKIQVKKLEAKKKTKKKTTKKKVAKKKPAPVVEEEEEEEVETEVIPPPKKASVKKKKLASKVDTKPKPKTKAKGATWLFEDVDEEEDEDEDADEGEDE